VKSNVEIFRLLAERMGLPNPCFRDTEDDMIRTLLASDHEFLKGITIEQLEEKHSLRLNVAPEGKPFLPFAEGGFGTPSGKCDFAPETLQYVPPSESRLGSKDLRARYPLEMVSSKNDDSMNSTFGHRASVDAQTAVVQIHSNDAGPRGIEQGDLVRIFNDRGSLVLRAEVNGTVREGVVRAPSTRWRSRASDGRNVNVLTSDRLTDIGGGATFFSCLVQVEKCGD
jgi:anaerobic selenocysteine-containing dehydrogenase